MSLVRFPSAPEPAWRVKVLLVLAVLVGLLGMHGLTSASAAPAAAVPMPAHAPAAFPADDCACHDQAHGPAGGHSHHADALCVAAGTSHGPALPALTLVAVEPAAQAGMPQHQSGHAVGGGRAPPSLSELQLLRI
ncbi:DUF6153 family protein [Streptomyces fildesensis]|uniref:DUF6153 family protein n=1 Tax=Streptomyces fildesensis TaxID=375757 RepID=UPI0018E038C3|nr:DUF6153 family protein [Streptomyces fildesensis]